MLSNQEKNLAQKESGLAATLLCVNVSWNWEPRQKHLYIVEIQIWLFKVQAIFTQERCSNRFK